MSETRIKLTAATNVGLVRKNNEDNFVVNVDLTKSDWLVPQAEEELYLGKYGALLVVADGMGGANAGEVASAIAIETIQKGFSVEKLDKFFAVREKPSENDIRDFVKSLIKKADLNILNKSKQDESTEGMGTTLVLAWLLDDKAYIAWCGDSRCYVFNAGSGICRLSKDHSYVQELIDQGKLDEENAFDHPFSNIITCCLGDPNQRAVPDFRSYNMRDGDLFLLCSDGLCGFCRDDEIIDLIDSLKDSVTECRDGLINAALSAGGYDNVTVGLCKVKMQEEVNADKINSTHFSKPTRKKGSKFFLFILLVAALLAIGFCHKNMFRQDLDEFAMPVDSDQVISADTIVVSADP